MPITLRIVKRPQKERRGAGLNEQGSEKREGLDWHVGRLGYPNPDSTHPEATILQSLDSL
jgi:hypothetical protein